MSEASKRSKSDSDCFWKCGKFLPLGVVWPFVLAVFGAFIHARFEAFNIAPIVLLWVLSYLSIPAMGEIIYHVLSPLWSSERRHTVALLLSIAAITAEDIVAGMLYIAAYIFFGGYIPC